MTTLSHTRPSLEDRILGATLIVVGSVDEGPVSVPEYASQSPQVHSLFRIAVEDTLRGRAPGSMLSVRVLGGQADDVRTAWTAPMRLGDRVLLLLAPYYAAEREEDVFVPYFRGVYPLASDATVDLGTRDAMSIEGVRSYVDAVLLRREQANAAMPERDLPEPEISEAGFNALLHVEPGGARWATLERSDGNDRSSG